jgi:predicted enzyme related to lactoylglutathione lyase
MFHWRDPENPASTGVTVWSVFPADTSYFGSGRQTFMMNFRVENLDELLTLLRAEGVPVEDKVEEYSFGKFAWITDPEGNRIELWQPPAQSHPEP